MTHIHLRPVLGVVLLMTLTACSAAEPVSDDVVTVASAAESAPAPSATPTTTATEVTPAATEPAPPAQSHAGHGTSEEPAAAGADTLDITLVDVAFEPSSIELVAGQPTTVTVRNDGVLEHDFDLPAADLHLHANPGEEETGTLQIDEPGTYEARCLIEGHAEAGMVMTVTVS